MATDKLSLDTTARQSSAQLSDGASGPSEKPQEPRIVPTSDGKVVLQETPAPEQLQSKMKRRFQEPLSPRRARKLEKDIANYKTEICRTHRSLGHCEYEDNCQFAHGIEELRPRQYGVKYKTQLCKNYHRAGTQFGECRFGARCKFVHDEQRVQVGDREFWLISPSDNLVRVEVVHNEARRAELEGLVQPASAPVAVAPAQVQAQARAQHQTVAPQLAYQHPSPPHAAYATPIQTPDSTAPQTPAFVPMQYSAQPSPSPSPLAASRGLVYAPQYTYGTSVPSTPMPYIASDYSMRGLTMAMGEVSFNPPPKTAQFHPPPRQTAQSLARYSPTYQQSPQTFASPSSSPAGLARRVSGAQHERIALQQPAAATYS